MISGLRIARACYVYNRDAETGNWNFEKCVNYNSLPHGIEASVTWIEGRVFADVVKASFEDFERADVVEANYENFERDRPFAAKLSRDLRFMKLWVIA